MQELFLKITGRVQGVFFRSETQRIARGLGLSGWVRNAGDGTLEILAQGDEENLKKLGEWAKRGPRMARVESIEKDYRKVTEKFNDFKIRF